jgi:hypothetical protein
MISAADLASMQSTAVATLQTTTCQISRKTPASDGMGGQTWAWSTVATTTCFVTSVVETDTETIDQSRLELLNRWLIYLPAGTDVTARDRILALGKTYEVTSVNAPETIQITTVVEAMLVLS